MAKRGGECLFSVDFWEQILEDFLLRPAAEQPDNRQRVADEVGD